MSLLEEGFRTPAGPSRNRPHGNLMALRLAVIGMFGIREDLLEWFGAQHPCPDA